MNQGSGRRLQSAGDPPTDTVSSGLLLRGDRRLVERCGNGRGDRQTTSSPCNKALHDQRLMT